MRRSEQKAKLKELYRQIGELKDMEIEEYDDSKPKLSKPKLYEEYWFIDGYGEAHRDFWNHLYGDTYRFDNGNVFKTEKEARYEVERRKVISELKRFSKKIEKYKDNYCIKYDMGSKEIGVYNNYSYATAELVFSTEKDAENAIEVVGKDRVLKYYLGVE